MPVRKRIEPDTLSGTFKKDGNHWHIEIPDVGCHTEATSVIKCIENVEKFIHELYEDEDLDVQVQVSDGGHLRITTSQDV